MDGRSAYLDNVLAKRLWRSLKYEAVCLHELADGLHAERCRVGFIDIKHKKHI